jgi:hypothetical protein
MHASWFCGESEEDDFLHLPATQNTGVTIAAELLQQVNNT